MVGVILMVAVTVILAAVIGSFVLGLGNNTKASGQAGVSYDDGVNGTTVTLMTVENADYVIVKTPEGQETLTNVGDTTSKLQGEITVIAVNDGKETVVSSRTASAAIPAPWILIDTNAEWNDQAGIKNHTVSDGFLTVDDTASGSPTPFETSAFTLDDFYDVTVTAEVDSAGDGGEVRLVDSNGNYVDGTSIDSSGTVSFTTTDGLDDFTVEIESTNASNPVVIDSLEIDK